MDVLTPWLIILLLAGLSDGGESPGQYCGTERRDVKQLLDPEAEEVNWAPQPTTIEALGALPAPPWSDSRKRSGNELMVFRVRAWLVSYKSEADGDLHLVLRGWRGGTMVAELPAVSCLDGAYDGAAEQARYDFERDFCEWQTGKNAVGLLYETTIKPKATFPKPVPVVVEGLGFFDKIHGQAGCAPNGIELHPVLSIKRQ